MRMSMLQTMMREHKAEVEELKAQINESQEVITELRQRLDANIRYFNEVRDESIRANTELFDALVSREKERLSRLQDRLGSLVNEFKGNNFDKEADKQIEEYKDLSYPQSIPRIGKANERS